MPEADGKGPPAPRSGAERAVGAGIAAADRSTDAPLRVSTLEIFFDLVFAFTLTQLASVLADRLSWLAVGQVLLMFGLLWWMYGGYAWLTNARPPEHTTERLLLLVGMAGFLVVGLAIPRGFASYSLALGLGYLLVVLVHATLFYRVNASADRTSLVLRALFYGNIPLLLGLVALAASVARAVAQAAGPGGAGLDLAARTGQAALLAAGAAFFLAGDVIARHLLHLGPFRLRLVAAIACLATIALGATVGLEAQLLLVTALLVAPLIAERGPAQDDSAAAACQIHGSRSGAARATLDRLPPEVNGPARARLRRCGRIVG
ncbi:MAG TPA: low temperature requirement protein A [Streptosporangiaceae bacterium]